MYYNGEKINKDKILNPTTHIIIINQNSLDRKILQQLLRSYNISFYDRIATAQKAIQESGAVLILIDGEFGDEVFAFCKLITTTPESSDIPVMFLFEAIDRDVITKMFKSGGCDYVSKPFNQIELTTRVYIHTSYISQKKELESLAYYDPMTQTYNRRTFFQHAHKAIVFSDKNKLSLHLIFFHFHSLHKINETYGYFAGDKIIQELSTIIKSVLKDKSIVGRLNGNSFAAIVTSKSGKDVSELASRISRRASEINIERYFPVVIEYVIVERCDIKRSIDDLMLEASKKLEKCEVARSKRNY